MRSLIAFLVFIFITSSVKFAVLVSSYWMVATVVALYLVQYCTQFALLDSKNTKSWSVRSHACGMEATVVLKSNRTVRYFYKLLYCILQTTTTDSLFSLEIDKPYFKLQDDHTTGWFFRLIHASCFHVCMYGVINFFKSTITAKAYAHVFPTRQQFWRQTSAPILSK